MNSFWKNIDIPLIITYIALVFIGLINVYSSSYDVDKTALSFDARYIKQLTYIAVAFITVVFILFLDPRIWGQYSQLFYAICMLLLIAVLVFGSEISGAKSWIKLGPISIQPSEFAKFATILCFSKYVSTPNLYMGYFKNQIRAFAIILLPIALIMLQPDAGSAIIFLAFVVVLFLKGMSPGLILLGFVAAILFILSLLINKFILIAAIVIILITALIASKKSFKTIFLYIFAIIACAGYIYGVDYAFDKLSPHQKDRINVFLNIEHDSKGVGYNVEQSKIAIGSGGFTGKGFLEGTQTKFNFVPEQSTDFIFCTVGEEWGWMGCSLTLGLFLFLILRIFSLSTQSYNEFTKIYGYSLGCILFMHVFINVGMTIGLVPVIGVPLPFISYGGSSLWAFTLMLFAFIKLSSQRHNQ